MDDKVISGLKWILDGDRFGFGMGWTEDSEPRDDHELAGYYIQRAIDLLKEQQKDIKFYRDRWLGEGDIEYYDE